MRMSLKSRTLAAGTMAGIAAALAALPAPASAQAQPCCPQVVQPSTLNLNVSSDVKLAPDIATVSAGVVTTARTARAAMRDNATRMSAAFAALRAAGIAERDMQTSGISLQPQYEYTENQRPRIVGYQVSNTVTVRMRDLEAVGPVLDALVAQGVNQLNGPTFGIDNPDEALDRVRREAMETAMRRARIYAEASGMRIRRVVTINESGGYQPPQAVPMMARAMAMDAAAETPVAAGEVGLSIQLNVQFELEPAGAPN